MQHARPLIEHLLAKGKLEAAIEGSLMLCRHYGDGERSSMAAHHSARYHTLMADYDAGTVGDDNYRIERAKINRAMLELAQSIPSDWTDEALVKAGFSANAFDNSYAPDQKSFLEKWGLILGLVASLMAILGVTLKDVIFPAKEQTSTTKPAESKPPVSDAPPKQEPVASKETAKPASTVKTPASKPEIKSPDKQPIQSSTNNQRGSLATSDERFRSFAKMKIVDDMERGYMGRKQAFRNVKTNQILCCYADAEDFSGGKAYVSKDGVSYFYMDKKGNRVE